MCGIFCELSSSEAVVSADSGVIEKIVRRGPDCICNKEILTYTNFKAYLYGAVLWMQGSHLTPQPVLKEKGFLLYNGDIFDESWTSPLSDTCVIMEKITSVQDDSKAVIEVFKSLKGPFSIIYYNHSSKELYFARDRIGRTSLLFHKAATIVFSSVLSRNYKCIEIPATHIHKYNLVSGSIETTPWAGGEQAQSTLDQWWIDMQQLQNQADEDFPVPIATDVDVVDVNNDNDIVSHIQQVTEQTKCTHTRFNTLLEHSTIVKVVQQLIDLLEKSVKIRLERQPNKCKNCVAKQIDRPCDHCAVGVLFSGGLDCTILALLADKFVPKEQSIDLLNVAFKKEDNATYDVPDRLTGRQSYDELKKLRPNRAWRFCEIDVPLEELRAQQSDVIADLVAPRRTVLDESLGTALWFAARGRDTHDYISTCRLILLGSGADELFGGYSRHRAAYRRHGWTALRLELTRDLVRIATRNLARDNRVLAHHGRQPRLPYLDERLVHFITGLPPWLRCYPSTELGPGVGDKLILRLVAYKLGLAQVAFFPKRALQFGSRIANKNERGNDLSKNFTNKINILEDYFAFHSILFLRAQPLVNIVLHAVTKCFFSPALDV